LLCAISGAAQRVKNYGGRLSRRSMGAPLVPIIDHSDPPFTIENMTCDFFTQPLNHFVPRGRSPSYKQRYCVFEDFATDNTTSPILFYVGNESPIENYINHTGLMWELAPKLKARVVFAEHRYEGKSLPNVTSDCLSYASIIQALADYAKILDELLNPHNEAPVIAFGGSYGGMLAGWFRMKYPHLVAGAIAASAPSAGFPQPAMNKIDWANRVLVAGLGKQYPPDDPTKQEPNECPNNLLAAFPLISWLAETEDGRDFLSKTFLLCDPLDDDGSSLLTWAQAIWFDLAEGSFPYPSSYIPFSLLHKIVSLPPWPTQDACWKSSSLHKDWGVQFSGNRSDVRYKVAYGDSGLALDVDWDNVTSKSPTSLSSIMNSPQVVGLLSSVRDAVSIWYNITKDVKCYDVSQAAPNLEMSHTATMESRRLRETSDPGKICQDAMHEMGSWSPLCCNDELNLPMTFARGLGADFFWPPSHPRSVKTYKDIVEGLTPAPCYDPDGIYGFSKEPYDPWSTMLETQYGSGENMDGHSNIIFSNGLLDPWSAGGVYAEHPWNNPPYTGPVVQKITDTDVIALIIEHGGHHTDLMYSSDSDPASVTKAREIQHDYISKWIKSFYEKTEGTNV